jgi:hypothetical protein
MASPGWYRRRRKSPSVFCWRACGTSTGTGGVRQRAHETTSGFTPTTYLVLPAPSCHPNSLGDVSLATTQSTDPDVGYEEDTCALPSGHDGWRRMGGHAGQESFEIRFRAPHAPYQCTPSASLRGGAGWSHPPHARSSSEPHASQSRLGAPRWRDGRCVTARVDAAARAPESRLKSGVSGRGLERRKRVRRRVTARHRPADGVRAARAVQQVA